MSCSRSSEKQIKKKMMAKFREDLSFGQIAEIHLMKGLKKHFQNVDAPTDSRITHDVKVECTFEVKRDRAAERWGNVAIELNYKKKPSGINASKADIWVWEMGGGWWWSRRDRLKRWLRKNKAKYTIKMGGDGSQSELAIIPILTFVNEIGNRIKADPL